MTTRRLAGVRVVVTRTREQSASLVDALEAEGAAVIAVPVIEIVDPADGGAALRSGLASLLRGDWVVISSPNGATRVGAVLADHPLAPGVAVAVIGPGTKARAEAAGITVDLIPKASIAEGLLEVLPGPNVSGGTMLLARAEEGRNLLPEGLRERGWKVLDVAAYRTIAVEVSDEDREHCRHADVAAFTSASTVRHLHAGAGVDHLPPVLAAIGPATAHQAAALGLEVDITATEHSIPGLVDALCRSVPDMVLIRPEDATAAESQWMLDRGASLTSDPDAVNPPNGLFLVARLNGDPVGCGVLKVVEPGVADIKRMWISDKVRGREVGRQLLDRLAEEARILGLRPVERETNRPLEFD
ncbi:MAG: uroporphyrinogen-III synthase/GNAT superfamily N-acetyltransferase [Candidatus Aldehydirespiratoraceae bacterium]|jgi:uroporphyrinogen-III synthase/GNAT superfamily N-acetyltransferase